MRLITTGEFAMPFCHDRYIRIGSAASAGDAANKALREAFAAAACGDSRRADEKAREAAQFLADAIDTLTGDAGGEVVRLHQAEG